MTRLCFLIYVIDHTPTSLYSYIFEMTFFIYKSLTSRRRSYGKIFCRKGRTEWSVQGNQRKTPIKVV